MQEPKRIVASFYKTDAGNEPVREFLKALSKAERKIVGEDIKTVEYGWPIGMPVCKPLGGGLFEVRSTFDTRICRTLFTVVSGRLYLLHAFIKKTESIPKDVLELAQKRKRDLEKNNEQPAEDVRARDYERQRYSGRV